MEEQNTFEQRLERLEQVPEIKPKGKFTATEIFIGIALVIILIVGSYALNYYAPQSSNQKMNQLYYNQGARDIYNNLIFELEQCKQVPLQLNNNQTVNAILVECLQQG